MQELTGTEIQKQTDNRGAPEGNLRAMLHGAYVKHLLDDQEITVFRQIVKELYDDFNLNYSSDAMLAVMCAFNFVRWHRALKSSDEDLAMKYRREVNVLLESLKATRDKREGTTIEIKTPAQWASELLAKANNPELTVAAKREKDVG